MCGSRRGLRDPGIIRARLAQLPPDTTVVEGGYWGVDRQARRAAESLGLRVETFRAQWGEMGRAAGPARNQRMLDAGADLVLAYPGDRSKGTWDMIRRCRFHGVPLEVHRGTSIIRFP